jgi:hypothetical protein
LVAAGPQIPGEPENIRKLAIFSLLRAPRRLEKPASKGRKEALSAIADKFLNATGGMV